MAPAGRNAPTFSVGSGDDIADDDGGRATHGKRKAPHSGFGDGPAGKSVGRDGGGGNSADNHWSSGTSKIDSGHLDEDARQSGGRYNNMRVSLTGSNGQGLRAFGGGGGGGGGANVTSPLETLSLQQTLGENVLLKQQLQELKDTIMRDNQHFEEGREAQTKNEEVMLAQMAVERKRCVCLVVNIVCVGVPLGAEWVRLTVAFQHQIHDSNILSTSTRHPHPPTPTRICIRICTCIVQMIHTCKYM
jgi:hypothetical protein